MKLLLLLLILSSLIAMRVQANDPGLPGEDPDLPVDGGVTLLLIAGAAYGLKKIASDKND